MNTINQRLIIASLMTLIVVMGWSTLIFSQPVITVRFANPQYTCNTDIICLDVEFQSNTANQELFGMNVRFFYDDFILELTGFTGLVANYSVVVPPTNSAGTLAFGQNYMGFQGGADYINGAIERTSTGTPVYISTAPGWTRIFSICFTVDNPYPSVQSTCPPLVWDLEANPANGGFFSTSQGVVMTVAAGGGNSAPVTENVDQYNWTYGPPGIYGHPIIESCTNVDCTLPVSLLSFTGFHDETGNHLQWQTATEINNYGFEVQRSQDGIQWEGLRVVPALASLQATKQYNFTDTNPTEGKNLYRLKQIDLDGRFQYSFILRLDANRNMQEVEILIYPNPVSDGSINVVLPQSEFEISMVNLISPTGQLVKQYHREGLLFQLDLEGLQSGMYLLRIERGFEEIYKRLIIE